MGAKLNKQVMACCIALGLSIPAFASTTINKLAGVQINQREQNRTQVILELARTADYQTLKLHNPERFVVDIDNTENQTKLNAAQWHDTVIDKIRFGRQHEHTLRVVFDLDAPVKTEVKILPGNAQFGERILLNLYAQDKTSQITVVKTAKAPAQPVLKVNPSTGKREVVVVIDPGHGGKDPGASGPHGVYEKDVVLAIAKDLCQLINAQPGMKAVLTRKGDYYIGLRGRLGIARKNKADVFVAVHADAYKDPYSLGASVYALSLRGASSEAARWIAAKENNSELGGVNLNDTGDTLRSVLIDLSQSATISSSLLLGNDVLANIGLFSPLHYKEVEQAAFVVLKSPDIPSVLIETGFISNPMNEQQLNDPIYQRKLAQAIFQGVNVYFNQRPPEGSLLAARIQAARTG